MTDTEQRLVDAIAAATDPIPPSLVLAAWLKGQDDPAAVARGELIELQAAIERGTAPKAAERRCRALIKEHLDAWTGELASRLGLKAQLRLGFVDSFAVPCDAPELLHDPLGEFAALFDHPMFRFAREADIGVFGEPRETGDQNGEYASYELSALFDAIVEVHDEDRPAPLRSLTLGFPVRPRWRPKCGVGRSRRFVFASADVTIADAAEHLKNLHTLKLRCSLDDPRALDVLAPHLVHYEYRPSDDYDPHGSRVLYDVAGTQWPHLESLAVGRTWYADWGDGPRTWGSNNKCRVEQLGPVFSGEAAPRLRHLALTETDLADDLCAALAASPLARQLTTLSLARGPLTTRGVSALVAGAAKFTALTQLDVQGCGLDEAALARLRSAFPSATLLA